MHFYSGTSGQAVLFVVIGLSLLWFRRNKFRLHPSYAFGAGTSHLQSHGWLCQQTYPITTLWRCQMYLRFPFNGTTLNGCCIFCNNRVRRFSSVGKQSSYEQLIRKSAITDDEKNLPGRCCNKVKRSAVLFMTLTNDVCNP